MADSQLEQRPLLSKMAMDKILSIIVPSYNMEAYLPKCLGSLVIDDRELFQKLDVIVVNDGSKDRTSEIAHEFETKYPGVFRVIDKTNGNYGSCINVALSEINGLFVKVLDADDWFDTGALSDFIHFLNERGGDVDLVLSDYETMSIEGTVKERHTCIFPHYDIFGFDEFLKNKSYLAMHTYTYRSAMLKDMGYRQLEGFSYTDNEWILVPMAHVSTMRYFPKVIYKYVLGREGQTMSSSMLAKHSWMLTEVYLHIAKQIDQLHDFASPTAKYFIEETEVAHLYGVYMDKIFHPEGALKEFNLLDFDARLKIASERLYELVGKRQYAHWLNYCMVDAWRRKSWSLGVRKCLCRLYSSIAMRLGAARGEN